MNRWPQVAGLIPRLRRAVAVHGGPTVEEVLREIQEQADRYPRRLSHLVALELYLAEITDVPIWDWLHAAGSSTNYAELLDKIEQAYGGDSGALFVTFNYDTMLEQAFNSIYARQISRLDDYIPKNATVLIKPHGSADWAQCLPAGRGPEIPGNHPATVIKFAPQLDFRGGDIMKRQEASNTGQIWHPAIAVPVDRTKTFVCPATHLERLTADLQKVTHLLVIGWRASEQHFLALLDENLQKDASINLCIVDRDAGALAAQQNLQRSLGEDRFGSIELHDEGFSAFVGHDRSDEWLSETASCSK